MKNLIIIALLTSFVSYAQTEEEIKDYWIDYSVSAHYKKDPYADSTLYLYNTDPTRGSAYINLSVKEDSAGRPVEAIFAFMPIDFNKETDKVELFVASTVKFTGNERERDYHIDYYARDVSWKIELYPHRNIVKFFYNLSMKESLYNSLIIYYLN